MLSFTQVICFVFVAWLCLCVHYVNALEYVTMGQTVTRILTTNDLLVSEEFAPPFRIDYYAFTETANSSLDILVVEKKSYDDFIGRGIEPVYIEGLSSVAVPSAKVRGNYNGGQNCVLLIRLNIVFTRVDNVTATYRYDYLQLYWGMSSWGFGVLAAVIAAVLLIVFIIMTALLFSKFVVPRCRR